MALRLFRSTGHAPLLMAGESRVFTHPGWVVFGISAWIGLVGNVRLWRWLVGGEPQSMAATLLLMLFVGAAAAALLSMHGRRLKTTASLLLLLAVVAGSTLWGHPGLALPLLDWFGLELAQATPLPVLPGPLLIELGAAVAVLAMPPVLWLWRTPLRRLAPREHRRASFAGLSLAALLLVTSGYALRMLSA